MNAQEITITDPMELRQMATATVALVHRLDPSATVPPEGSLLDRLLRQGETYCPRTAEAFRRKLTERDTSKNYHVGPKMLPWFEQRLPSLTAADAALVTRVAFVEFKRRPAPVPPIPEVPPRYQDLPRGIPAATLAVLLRVDGRMRQGWRLTEAACAEGFLCLFWLDGQLEENGIGRTKVADGPPWHLTDRKSGRPLTDLLASGEIAEAP